MILAISAGDGVDMRGWNAPRDGLGETERNNVGGWEEKSNDIVLLSVVATSPPGTIETCDGGGSGFSELLCTVGNAANAPFTVSACGVAGVCTIMGGTGDLLGSAGFCLLGPTISEI